MSNKLNQGKKFINTARKWDKTAEGRRVQEGRKTRKKCDKGRRKLKSEQMDKNEGTKGQIKSLKCKIYMKSFQYSILTRY